MNDPEFPGRTNTQPSSSEPMLSGTWSQDCSKSAAVVGTLPWLIQMVLVSAFAGAAKARAPTSPAAPIVPRARSTLGACGLRVTSGSSIVMSPSRGAVRAGLEAGNDCTLVGPVRLHRVPPGPGGRLSRARPPRPAGPRLERSEERRVGPDGTIAGGQ